MPQGRRVEPGGSERLGRLLTDHAGAIEADLLRYYQIDLLDLYRRRLSLRRLIVLVRHLPEDSALRRACAGPDHIWAPLDRQLLARLSDQIADLAYWYRTVHTPAKKRDEDPPEWIRRPGVVPRHRPGRIGNTRGRPAGDVTAYLDRFRPREVTNA